MPQACFLNQAHYTRSFFIMARLEGFGLSSRLLARCRAADSLAFARSVHSNPRKYATGMFSKPGALYPVFLYHGTPGGIRTPDARIRSPTLYPTELQALYIKKIWGEKRDSNPRPQEPQSCALIQLSYSHH